MKESTLDTLSRRLTARRFKAKNALTKNRVYCATPVGAAVTADVFLGPLADFLAGRFPERPNPLPKALPEGIRSLIAGMEANTLALMALAPLLHRIHAGWQGKEPKSAEMLLKKAIGDEFRARISLDRLPLVERCRVLRIPGRTRAAAIRDMTTEWSAPDCVRVGHWLLQCALSLDLFDRDAAGFPIISAKWQGEVDQIRQDMWRRDRVHLPHTEPPPDWTEWHAEYGDRLRATFVRDWRPQTRAAIEAAFAGGVFEHARAVSALQRVPFRINPTIPPLVRLFAVELMNHKGAQRDTDQTSVDDCLAIADEISSKPFWLGRNCDRRGRIYSVSHFRYEDEDLVRAMFRFAHGGRLHPKDLPILQIHTANCEGSTDRESWGNRIKWADDNREMIQKIAADPIATYDLWRKADRRFSFVAACCELAGAWADPGNFITRLPVSFDASANGIQHLALLCRDTDAAKRVNLIASETPQDLYADIIVRTRKLVEFDHNKWATWWRNRLKPLDQRQLRKLLKTPGATFAYNVTNHGMVEQINDVYRGLFDGNEPRPEAAHYLAKEIRQACEELLPGPAGAMKYICDLADHCTAQGRVMEWTSPTGLPIANRYEKPNTKKRVHLVTGGVEIRHKVADGCLPTIRKLKTRNASAPNFIHSLDAAHLVRVVNAAVSDGITDIVAVHDSFGCLASQARRLHYLIRRELLLLYVNQDHLGALGNRNADEFPPPPPISDLDIRELLEAENLAT
jgi:hypothetical protein